MERDLRELIDYMVQSLVEHPEEVRIAEKQGDRSTIYQLSVHRDDRGRVIGKNGQTIKAIRSIVMAAATLKGVNATVDVTD